MACHSSLSFSSSSCCASTQLTRTRIACPAKSPANLGFSNSSFHAKLSFSNGLGLFSSTAVSQSRSRIPLRVHASQVERSYVMIKPDGVQRGLVGEIISRFENKGFKLTGLKLFQCPEELAKEHYKDLSSKPFFPSLVQYITSGPVVCLALEGTGVVASARKLIGATNPLNAEAGTIRGDLAIATGRNVVHGSDSPENGEREIALWFKEGELCDWEQSLNPWLVE